MAELRELLPAVAPPPGGEVRLRRALRSAPVARARWPAVAFASLALALVAAWLPGAQREAARARRVEVALQAVLAPGPALAVTGAQAREVPTGAPEVRVYVVTRD